MKKNISRFILCLALAVTLAIIILGFCACSVEAAGSSTDTLNTQQAADHLQANQPTPTDIDYSLERYNLIRRAYWVNGQREKANALPCEIAKPLGYVVLLTESGSVVGKFTVDGKVSSLNSFLTPDSEYYELLYGGDYSKENNWLADIDGSYGENDNGIFFFTPDGKYVEWSGIYLYSDIPFEVETPVVSFKEG
ncbi:MAG: hypothetical protein SPC78_05805 [Candidatus Faecousia sp.]|nr:hypothetical protein [Candidatus Faecousia sp.]